MRLMPFTLATTLLAFGSLAFAASPDLPPGAAKATVEQTCTACHDTKMITKQHQSRKWWSDTLEKMVGYGAQIEDKDRPAVLSYLSKNFGERTGKKIAKKR